MKNYINTRKNKEEKGAITLFVLLACLFLIFILSGIYISNVNKMQTQEQEVKQIQENYAKEVEDIDDIYDRLVVDIITKLTQDPANGTWVNEVTLTGTGEVREGKDLKIVGYGFCKDTEEMPSKWTTIGETTKTSQDMKVTEGGEYYFWVKDNNGKAYRSNKIDVRNIDKINPIAGSIIAKIENKDGEDYTFDTWVDKSVYVEKVDGKDNESGHQKTTMTIKKNGVSMGEEYTDREEPVTLTESGVYTVTVTTTDKAGNTATSQEYTIKIDKAVPVLALKHNNATGADYNGEWTKDDLYGEINLTSGRPVKKYQYSYNGVIWNDISSEIIPNNVDYTSTFPLSDNKPEWITQINTTNNSLNSNGKYYFEVQEDGTLKPNNSGVNSTTASSYFEIDLTDYPDSKLNLTLDYTISSENNYDWGYATIVEDEQSVPAYNVTTGRFVYVSGATKTEQQTTEITGGKKYRLYIGYRKDGSGNTNQDTFIINSIRLQSEELGKNLNFYNYNKSSNQLTFTLKENMDKEIYVRAIYEDENISKYGNKTTIKIDKTAPKVNNTEMDVISNEKANATINVIEKGSGMKAYYTSTEETEPTESSNWVNQTTNEINISDLKTGATYYLWLKDNVENISEKQMIVVPNANYLVDNKIYTETLEEAITKANDGSKIELLNDYADESVATIDKNITFDVKEYTLTRNKVITINSSKTVEITGTGKITSESNNTNTISNYGTLTISNKIVIENKAMQSGYTTIYNNSTLNIADAVNIIGNYQTICNSRIININGGNIKCLSANNINAYAIYNNSNISKLYMNTGEIKGYNGIYNGSSSSNCEINNGKIIGTSGYGICNGIININGGRIEGKTYGVQSSYSNKITIGKETDELSTTIPAIYGGNYSIYLSDETYEFNFYNGVLISNTEETAYKGKVNPRTGYVPYTYIDYEVEQKYSTILVENSTEINMSATPTEYTNKDVIVEIVYPYTDGLTREYSEDGQEWKEASQIRQRLFISENKIIYARTINESGIVVEEKQLNINNIDKEIPTVTVTPEKTKYYVLETNGTVDLNITIKAQDTGVSGLDIMQYAWAKEGEQPQYIDFTNEITFLKNKLTIGQYNLYLKVTDKAGNEAELKQIRYNVEYQEPVCQIGTTKYLTIQDAVETCKKAGLVNADINETYTFPMEKNKPSWISEMVRVSDSYYFEEQADGTLKPNNSGENSTIAGIYFKIDLSEYSDAKINLTLNYTISSETRDYGYATIVEDGQAMPPYSTAEGRFVYVSGTTRTEQQSTEIIGGKKYRLYIGYRKDSVSSKNNDTFIINNIKLETNGIQEREILDATRIEMLKNTDEEFEIHENQNIILDLKGEKIGSSSMTTSLCTNNGTLQIVDTSTEKTGKIESLNGICISNTSTGELTIGDNSNAIEMDVPTIYGQKIGIKNENKFNFYDGKIQGIIPIHGNTTGTPNEYGPVSTGYEKGITTVQLGIVKKYEARIDWVYYTKLQEAINAIKTSSKETVTIVKDIQLQDIADVSVAKNMILDLSGYTLTIVSDKEKVIENNGNLEITDSSIEKTGIIKIEKVGYGIYNVNKGNLVVRDGTIKRNCDAGHISGYGIYNAGTGNITINGGVVSNSNGSESGGIYNANTGNIIINGGTVINNGSAYYNSGYGIYNASTGNIIVNEGEVINNTEGEDYGIYNARAGNVIINGGIISVTGSGGDDARKCRGIQNASTGNITINGGTVICNKSSGRGHGIYNENAGDIIVAGGTINCTSYDNSGLYNAGTGNVTISGGEIISNCTSKYFDTYGVYNLNNGNVIVSGGTINCNNKGENGYGIYNASVGTIVIGKQDKEIVSEEKIYVKSVCIDSTSYYEDYKGYGIYNELGKLEFYNGKIQGSGLALYGNITKIRDGYKIEEDKTDTIDTLYLTKSTNSDYIVQIENVKFYTLKEAMESIKDNEVRTIKVLKDFELSEPIVFDKNIILDLNQHTITNNYYRIENNGELLITDSTGTQNGKIECINTISGLYNSNEGNVTVNSVTVSNKGFWSKSNGMYNNSTGNIIINGGIISSVTECSTSKGSNLSSNEYKSCGILNASTGNVIVNGGTLSAKYGVGYGIYNKNTGNIEVNGGNIECSASSYCYGIYNDDEGNVIISGGVLNCDNNKSGGHCYGIQNESIGNVIVSGGTINNTSSGYCYGLHNKSTGTVTVSGGTINSNNEKEYSFCTSYGIYNESTGIITVGTQGDGIVSQEQPYIMGKNAKKTTDSYGIYNTKGKFYFYDGKIEGTTKAVYDIITEREENTELNYNENETVLTLTVELIDVAQIGNITYKSLQDAIDSVENTQTVIKILRNVTYTKQDTIITIPSTKNIIMDLNGYKIASAMPESVIKNEGILEIKDTSEKQTGTITTSEETTINNVSGAKLVISGGTIENRTKQTVYNEGQVTITGGIIICKTSNNDRDDKCYGIYNTNTGNIIVNNGTIESISNERNYIAGSYGIYNGSTGSVTVNGGIVNGYNSECSSGIYNANTGNIIVSGGIVNGFNNNFYHKCYGIYNASTGTIIIGKQQDGIISQEEPSIKATDSALSCGAYNLQGKLYFYDGKIQGYKQAVIGTITEIENLSELTIGTETVDNIILNTLTLKQITGNVAKVNGVEYDSIEKAIKACGTEESTIEILRDSDPGATLVVESNQNITIDLKGYTINNYIEVQNAGTLKIKDTSTTQTGKIVGKVGMAIINTGTLELQSGSIADSGIGIKNLASGVINVTGGKFANNTYGLYNDSDSAIINITAGSIELNTYGIYNSAGTTNITSTGINNNTYGVYIAEGTVNVKENAEVRSETGIYNQSGTLNIGETGNMNPDKPLIIGEKYGLVNKGIATTNMYDGQIKGKEASTQGFVTHTETGYSVVTKTEGEYMVDYLALSGTIQTVAQVNGIDFSNLQSAINSITDEEQTIKLTNGIITTSKFTIEDGQNIILDMNGKTISSDLDITIENKGNLKIIDSSGMNVAKISSTVGIAIKNSGTLTLGENDGTVNQDILTIEGGTYGIETSGTLNFYDGTINGASAVQGTVTARADGYLIRTTTVNGKERYYLSK